MLRLTRRVAPLALYALWALLALYPDPSLLVRSIPQGLNPRIDPAAVKAWADELPDDPEHIERQVLGRYVSYAVPWQTHGVPWYFPTTAEVVAQGRGDCQTRMLVFASILQAKNIPYRLEASFDHIWVWYAEKKTNTWENAAIRLMVEDGSGRRLQLPQRWDWRETYRIEKEYFWDYMPLGRKLLLFGGMVLIFFRGRLASWVRTASA